MKLKIKPKEFIAPASFFRVGHLYRSVACESTGKLYLCIPYGRLLHLPECVRLVNAEDSNPANFIDVTDNFILTEV